MFLDYTKRLWIKPTQTSIFDNCQLLKILTQVTSIKSQGCESRRKVMRKDVTRAYCPNQLIVIY